MVLVRWSLSCQSPADSPYQPPTPPSDEGSDNILDDFILDLPSHTAAMAYDQHPDHFNGDQGFLPASHPTWQSLPSNQEPMHFSSMSQQGSIFPADSTAHFQPHADQSPDFNGHDAHWQPQTHFAHPPQTNPFGAFHHEPAIKSEELYPQQVEPASPHGLPPSNSAEPHNTAAAMSPQSENGWMSTSSSDHTEKPLLKREQLSLFIDNPPRLRPDGVRKKNARFEIPEDRKVDTIDHIIKQTDPSDEALMKELKQQKRLLRNRQAALDSRCRKKEHTMKLEEERKILVHNLEGYQEEIHQLRHEKSMWLQEQAQWQATLDRMMMEKEELVRQHTLETAELRKKNNMLMEDMQRRASLPMSAVPSSAGYSSTFSEFDHLSMNDSPTWEDFSLLHHGQTEPEMPKPRSTAVQAKGDESTKEDDKSVGSGLLLMLLLCGAWVASKGSTTASGMPQMPENVRAASNTVLDNIYKDAGLPAPVSNENSMAVMNTHAPHQHAFNPAFTQGHNPFTTFNQLTAPTTQQQRDEVFSLTPVQYNAITSDDSYYSTPQASPPKDRRCLQDALSTIRLNKRGTASESYTKSLLWDEVPTNVVRDFARMMSERNAEPLS